ncbi:MAG TPA: hypothetical protein VG756_25060 [Pseudonocardiaceae bacterium]|nr:hypothetical protein [Pseudonocardiaceae bacterium]
MILTGIGLSVLAAIAYAVAAALQHGAVRELPGASDRLGLSQLRTLLARRRWLLGLLGTGIGAGLHVVALSVAPLVLVQPIGVLAIALTALFTGSRLTRTTLFAVAACTAGVGLFVLLAAHGVSAGAGQTIGGGGVLPVSAGVVGALVLAATAMPARWRSPLLGTAAGVAYGTVSVLTRAVSQEIRASGLPGVSWPAVLGALAAIVTGAWCVQQAYAAGRADTVQACQTVTDPLVGVLTGVFAFGEVAAPGALGVTGELACAALALTGVILLARRGPQSPAPQPDHREPVAAGSARSFADKKN